MNTEKIKVIITGTTGMVGEGVLHECLLSDNVETILVINRRPCGITHPKLTEIIHADFFNLAAAEDRITGYNACFFCLGVSSVGMKAEQYYRMTYSLTIYMAGIFSRQNKEMTFCYVSGKATDSSEKGRVGWARVKGKTENDLHKLGFKKIFAFRPGFILPTKGLKYTQFYYKYISWMFPIGRSIYPQGFCTLKEMGRAMIHSITKDYQKDIIEGKDIIELAK